jgi:hypothetical protein
LSAAEAAHVAIFWHHSRLADASTTDRQRLQEDIMTTQATDRKTLRLVVHGHVQGVYFRDSMRR